MYAITGRHFEHYIQPTSGTLPVKEERTASTSTGKVRMRRRRQVCPRERIFLKMILFKLDFVLQL
jgi:hypothetical protein